MLVRPPMTDFKMTILIVPSLSLQKLLLLLIVIDEESAFGQTCSSNPPTSAEAGIQNKPNFPFHQPDLLIGFWMASNQTPLSITY